MTLYQILRYCSSGFPVVLFDIRGVERMRAKSKDTLPVDLFDENVYCISIGNYNTNSYTDQYKPAFFITLMI